MSKATKAWLIAAASLVAVGLILFAAVMTVYRGDFTRLGTVRFETNTHEVSEEFTAIQINTETADILFAASGDNGCRVVCCEEETAKHSVSVQDGTLIIAAADKREWYKRIGFGFRSPTVTVYLPKAAYGSLVIRESTGDITLPEGLTFDSVDLDLSTGQVDSHASAAGLMRIKTSTGDIRLRDLSAGELDLTVTTGQVDVRAVSCRGAVGVSVSTGEAKLTDISCRRVVSAGSTGDTAMENVIATERISVERSTGNVRLAGCDAGELEITTDTGDVTGSLLSDKVFIAHSDTGRVDVPETATGGKCKITTDTGDIRMTVE